MSDEELKPCPFCAGDDIVHQPTGDDYYTVWCRSCGGKMLSKPSKEEAFKAWNKRTPELTTLQTEVTELRDTLESIKQYAAGKELLLKGSPELRSIINTISRVLTTVTGEDN